MQNDMAFPGFESTSGHGSAKIDAHGNWQNFQPGMSLFQYYVGQALIGITRDLRQTTDGENIENIASLNARLAIVIAEKTIEQLMLRDKAIYERDQKRKQDAKNQSPPDTQQTSSGQHAP